jgi:hypothetical protein
MNELFALAVEQLEKISHFSDGFQLQLQTRHVALNIRTCSYGKRPVPLHAKQHANEQFHVKVFSVFASA